MSTFLRNRSGSAYLWAGISLIVVGAFISILEPTGPFNMVFVGNLLILSGLWATLFGLLQIPIPSDSTMTYGEKQAYLAFAVTAALGMYLVYSLYTLGWVIDLNDRSVQRTGSTIVQVLIASAVLSSVLRHRERGHILEDERDRALRQQASNAGYTTILTALAILIVTLGLTPRAQLLFSSPVAIAYALIGVIIASELVRYTGEIWLYRRNRP